MIQVVKHDGRVEPFNSSKIFWAVKAAGAEQALARKIAEDVADSFRHNTTVNVELKSN